MTPDRVDFGGEPDRDVLKRVEQGRHPSQDGPELKLRHVFRVACPNCCFEFTPSLRLHGHVAETLTNFILKRSHLAAEPNRSGGEGQGSLGGEPTGELREDCQVGVEPDPVESSDAEREE